MSEPWREGQGDAPDLHVIDDESLRRELEQTRARLAEAEWALANLGPSDEPFDARLREMLDAARREASEIKATARQQAELVVREAERLRVMAEHASSGGTEQARQQIARKVSDMVTSADQLRINAERKAAEIIRNARESVAPTQARTDELSRLIVRQETELVELEAAVKDARLKADSIIRNARVEAEARVAELADRARQRLEAARLEAERIVAAAHERASHFS